MPVGAITKKTTRLGGPLAVAGSLFVFFIIIKLSGSCRPLLFLFKIVSFAYLSRLFYPVNLELSETTKRSRKLQRPLSVVSGVVVRELTHRQSMQSDPRVRAE